MGHAQLLLRVFLIQISYLCGTPENQLTAAAHDRPTAEVNALQVKSHRDFGSRATFDGSEVLKISRVDLKIEWQKGLLKQRDDSYLQSNFFFTTCQSFSLKHIPYATAKATCNKRYSLSHHVAAFQSKKNSHSCVLCFSLMVGRNPAPESRGNNFVTFLKLLAKPQSW